MLNRAELAWFVWFKQVSNMAKWQVGVYCDDEPLLTTQLQPPKSRTNQQVLCSTSWDQEHTIPYNGTNWTVMTSHTFVNVLGQFKGSRLLKLKKKPVSEFRVTKWSLCCEGVHTKKNFGSRLSLAVPSMYTVQVGPLPPPHLYREGTYHHHLSAISCTGCRCWLCIILGFSPSIPRQADTVLCEGRHMKQSWIKCMESRPNWL